MFVVQHVRRLLPSSIVREILPSESPPQHFSGPVVDLRHILTKFFLGDIVKTGRFGEVTADAAVEVFVRSPLEGRIRVTKIGGYPMVSASV